MRTKKNWKDALLGSFEIFLFMRQGVERFSTSKEAAVKSFIWPAVLLPFVLFIYAFHSTGYSAPLLLSLHGARILISFSLFLYVLYMFSRHYGRAEHFYRAVTVQNWMNAPIFLFTIPIIVSLFANVSGTEDLFARKDNTYATFVTLGSYVYLGFVLTHSLKIPWEMCGFLAIVGLAIDQELLDGATLVRDYLTAG